jgi:hypothetical protein
MSVTAQPPLLAPSTPVAGGRVDAAKALAARGDKWYLIGCLVCGTWVLGPIGLPIMIAGIVMMRRAQNAGVAIRPWSITIVGGLLLVDASVNCLAWCTAFMWAHSTHPVETLWIGYGHLGDGGYASFFNSTQFGGSSSAGEMSVCLGMGVLVAMPLKIVGAWGLLKMKRWGLQWSIIANWLYFLSWVIYSMIMILQFPQRFGVSNLGVLGFWLFGGLPFLGPIVLLPYLHTLNPKRFSK